MKTMLNEEVYQLDEFRAIGKVFRRLKNMGKDALRWVNNLMGKIFKKLKQQLDKIKQMGERFFGELFSFLGIEISKVTASFPKELDGFI